MVNTIVEHSETLHISIKKWKIFYYQTQINVRARVYSISSYLFTADH